MRIGYFSLSTKSWELQKLAGKQRRIESLELCLDNLTDHLDELRELFRGMREVTGLGGFWTN